jgi:hypothetical protein
VLKLQMMLAQQQELGIPAGRQTGNTGTGCSRAGHLLCTQVQTHETCVLHGCWQSLPVQESVAQSPQLIWLVHMREIY